MDRGQARIRIGQRRHRGGRAGLRAERQGKNGQDADDSEGQLHAASLYDRYDPEL